MRTPVLLSAACLLSVWLSVAPVAPVAAQTWEQAAGTAGINMQCVLSAQGWDFGGGALGTFRSSDGGGSFEEANVGNTSMGPTRGFTSDETYVYKCTSNGVFRSGDNGAGWESVATGLPQMLTHGMTATAGRVWVATQTGVFASDDQGMTWEGAGLDGLNVRCITAWEEVVFVGTIDEGLFKSEDGGASWEAINNGSTSNSFRAIEAHAGMVFAGGEIGTGVFRSQDMGASWELLGGGLPMGSYRGFATDGEWIVAGSFMAGVFASSDGGDTWMEFNAGLGDLSIFDLCFNQDHLVAATNASGIWRLPRTALESTGMGQDVAARVWTLYPNPAGDVATLGGLPPAEPWWAQLIGLDGRVVKEFNGEGDTRLSFAGLPCGTYRLRVTSESVGAQGIRVAIH